MKITSTNFLKAIWIFIPFFLSLNSVNASCSNGTLTSGCSFSFNGSSAPTIISLTPPFNNIAAGSLSGKAVVSIVSKINDGANPSYNVRITVDGVQKGNAYRLSQSQINQMSSTAASLDSTNAFKKMNEILAAKKQCPKNVAGISPTLNSEKPEQSPKEAVNRLNEERYASRTTDDPEERQRRDERRRQNQERIAQGDAPIASGRTIAVGSGSGLINMREDDEGIPTPECDQLRVTPEEADEEEFTNENLASCISAIQAIIMDGLQSPAHPKDRNLIFSRLFNLPNEEQEFAAALFTLAGETNASEKPMDRLMILKVLANRRNNANKVEDEIAECRSGGGSDLEVSDCIADAQKDAQFNLLDLALDESQFSMYNNCPGTEEMSAAAARSSCSENANVAANWFNNLGNTSNDFSDEIDIFLNYENLEEINVHGQRSSSIDIEKIYHYVTPAVAPQTAWVRSQPSNSDLRLSATTKDGEELEMTTAHWFYYNVDAFGSANGDGLARTPSHNFRQF